MPTGARPLFRMQIEISQGHEPPDNTDGITVVIDVIRAFTTCYYALRTGVERIWAVRTAEEAFALQKEMPHIPLVGEIGALPIPGFDYGNSPLEISRARLPKEMVIRTTNGVAATLNARRSRRILVTGLVNADATVEAIRGLSAGEDDRILLVASHPTGDEDMACAEYILDRLGGPGITLEDAIERVRHSFAAQKFLHRVHPRLHPEDIHMAADSHGTGGFAMIVEPLPRPVIRRLDRPFE